MKITKTANRNTYLNQQETKANKGCHICPCCGETRDMGYCIRKGILDKGIMSGMCSTWAEGFIKNRNMKTDHYHCLTCGAEWESDPYEWA